MSDAQSPGWLQSMLGRATVTGPPPDDNILRMPSASLDKLESDVRKAHGEALAAKAEIDRIERSFLSQMHALAKAYNDSVVTLQAKVERFQAAAKGSGWHVRYGYTFELMEIPENPTRGSSVPRQDNDGHPRNDGQGSGLGGHSSRACRDESTDAEG